MTLEDLKFGIVAFSAVFFVVDPVFAVPVFLSITARDPMEKRRATAWRAALAAFVMLTLFGLAGGVIFQMFGISLGAFKTAGGIMLLLMSIDMMRAQPSRTRSSAEEESESAAADDVALVPMAVPVLSGPAAIATVMVFMSRAAWHPMRTAVVLGSIAVTCFVAWILMRSALAAQRFIRQTTVRVFERVMGMLLSAVAVEFIVGGLRDLWG